MSTPSDNSDTDFRTPGGPGGPDPKRETAARVALESKLMFLEDTLESLHEVVLAQGKHLEQLSRRLEDLHKRVTAPTEAEGGERSLEDDRPPHY